MPDHLHLLLEGQSEKTGLRNFVQLFKQLSSYHWKHEGGADLWQRSYYDRVLRADEDTLVVARYILMNPVRKGLCQSPEQHPFSGSLTHDMRSLLTAAQDIRRT